MKRIPSLDGFRAISIILVLFCHSVVSIGFPTVLAPIARLGDLGVTIFFVISGFIITFLLLNEEAKTGTINLRSFYIRRFLRILPVYLLYIGFILLWGKLEQLDITTSNLVHALTFTVNFDSKKNWFIGHFWSVSVEEQFYLLWPAMLIFFRKNLKMVLIILIAYSCLARVIAYKFPGYEVLSLAPFFKYSDPVFIGALGGILYFENKNICKVKIFNKFYLKILLMCLIVSFRYFVGTGKFGLIALPFGKTIISASILVLILPYLNPSNKPTFRILNSKVLIHIGVLSYSIYVWQEMFFTGHIQFFRIFPFNIFEIYCVSLVSYYLWEKQFLKIKVLFENEKITINHQNQLSLITTQYRNEFIKKGIKIPLNLVPFKLNGLLKELPRTNDKAGWPWQVESDPVFDKNIDYPLISIIIPSYNQGNFIEEAIRSILLQNYPKLELIIIDGGSVDNTKELLSKYSPWISYWQSEKDKGQGHAINLGFSIASGDYYGWLNSDDYYNKDSFFVLSREILKAKKDFYYGDSFTCYNNGSVLNFTPSNLVLDIFLRFGGLIPSHSAFWKRSVNKPIWETMNCNIDGELWIRLVKGHSKKHIKFPLGTFRQHPDNKSTSESWIVKWKEDDTNIENIYGKPPHPRSILAYFYRFTQSLYKSINLKPSIKKK